MEKTRLGANKKMIKSLPRGQVSTVKEGMWFHAREAPNQIKEVFTRKELISLKNKEFYLTGGKLE